jgi:hypothetical protein
LEHFSLLALLENLTTGGSSDEEAVLYNLDIRRRREKERVREETRLYKEYVNRWDNRK